MEILIVLLPLFPLLGAILNGFLLRKCSITWVAVIGTLCVFAPFIITVFLFIELWAHPSVLFQISLFDWISLPLTENNFFSLPFTFTVDRLTILPLLLITGIGTLIHIYSHGYMHAEKGIYRFYCYLNLFVFSMLCLVMGSNMVVTFLGWEGVGMCSYLLIGYWHTEKANAKAGMKAFVANRIGDLGFLIAMFFCYQYFGTLDYAQLARKLSLLSQNQISLYSDLFTLIAGCILLAVTGKSAQLPLYVWLPDAMAGPTPVSALIHAATMVTAGIYLMVRLSPLMVLSPTAMAMVASAGAITALGAATIGLVQVDIKKVLAYSTVSQLGYMVLACGTGAFEAAMGHLITHAFFKALLFLGAGSVIHGMHHEQSLLHMGGLFKKMPITGITFILGTLAIIGFPGFSGFFSKDEILFHSILAPFGHPIYGLIGLLGALCTAFYMVRLTTLVFFTKPRSDHVSHAHESPWTMTMPLIILALLSCVGGLIVVSPEINHLFTGEETKPWLANWLSPVLAIAHGLVGEHNAHGAFLGPWQVMGISTVGVLIFALLSLFCYGQGLSRLKPIRNAWPRFYQFLFDKYRVDEFYNLAFIEPLKHTAGFLENQINLKVIEGIINKIPHTLKIITLIISDHMTGNTRVYLKIFGLSLFGFLAWVIYGC